MIKFALTLIAYISLVAFFKLQLIDTVDRAIWPTLSAYWLGFAMAFAPFPKA